MSWAYTKDAPSAWEPRTAKMNFCELDYYMTPYIAEFVNTLSNISYLALAWHGYRQVCRNGGSSTIKLAYGMLAFVGFGSIIFHASLKYSCQLVDELAMLYATAVVLYAVFQPLFPSLPLAISLATSMGIITYLNTLTSGESLTHRISFGLMIMTVGLRCMYLQSKVPLTSPINKSDLRTICIVGTISFVSGFGLWLTDVFACETLQEWREVVGFPLGAVLELHGWWHILTAYGVYWYILFVEYLQECREGQELRLEWSCAGMVPHIMRIGGPRPAKLTNSVANGRSAKSNGKQKA